MSGGDGGRRRLIGGLLGELAAGVAACRSSERIATGERTDLTALQAELDACGAELWQEAARSAGLAAAPGNRRRIAASLRQRLLETERR